MLQIVSKASQLNFQQLSAVYAGSGISDSFYRDIYDFFEGKDSIYALWVPDNVYASAVRVERYRDGFLISGLETVPSMRQRGYAKALLSEVLQHLECERIYSHVERDNQASLAVHKFCGFEKIKDGAVFLDGSASSSYVTLCKNNRARTSHT